MAGIVPTVSFVFPEDILLKAVVSGARARRGKGAAGEYNEEKGKRKEVLELGWRGGD